MLYTSMTRRLRLVTLLALFVTLFVAAVAYAEPAGPERTVHFTGLVQVKPASITGSWQIAGREVVVTGQTQFRPAADAIQQNDLVAVDAKMRDGALVAHAIVKMPQPPQRMITGKIEALAADKWSIGNQEILVNVETRLEGDLPDVGDMATAWVERTDQGLLAKSIVVKDPPIPPPGPRFVVFRGIVMAIDDAGVYTIGTEEGVKQVKTDDQTRIVGGPIKDDTVLVKGQAMEGGSVLALMIVKLGEDQQHEQTPFSGFVIHIESIPLPMAAEVSMQWLWDVTLPAHGDELEKTWKVLVDANTNINVDPNTVEEGVFIKGAGLKLDDASIQAHMVRVTRPPQVRFEGRITDGPEVAVDFPWGAWQVDGKTVLHISADTHLVGEPPAVGKQAAGLGLLRQDGSIEARLFVVR